MECTGMDSPCHLIVREAPGLSPVFPPAETNTELTGCIWAEWLGIVLRGYLGTSSGKLMPIPVPSNSCLGTQYGISFRNRRLASVTSSDKRIFCVLKYGCWGKFLMNTALEVSELIELVWV